MEREHRHEVRLLNQEVTSFSVDSLISEIREHWTEVSTVMAFLNEVQKYVIEHGEVFQLSNDQASQSLPIGMMDKFSQQREQVAGNCHVNVLVCNKDIQGAPVVFEDNPTVENLFGRIESRAEFGNLLTDFHLIKPGALHRANGGYIILDARRLIMNPFAWETLKRTLRSREIRIESLNKMLSLSTTISLQPEPIPLDVKVILIGDPPLYYLLSQYDPDFHELFKVPADFDDTMSATDYTIPRFTQLIATQTRQNNLLALDNSAVAKVFEQMTRLAGDIDRISSHVRSLVDLLVESDHWARNQNSKIVGAKHVTQAISAHIHRSDRLRVRIQDQFEQGTIALDTSGERVGQINGLSVLQLGGFAFGRPCRITARVRLGRGQVVDIEREVELGGPLHSKGVLILSNYLAAHYTQDQPLSLNASLVFEQSYGMIDGDSASSTELYALLSALADTPIKQSYAVTGSVNQFGEVQAIGGVNEKIEGFFDICAHRGLDGNHAVLIPASNVKHLMLRENVVEAVERGKFNVYPISTIDQGIEILTGVAAGKLDDDGHYPINSINGRVQARLRNFTKIAEEFGKTHHNGKADDQPDG